MKIMELSTRDAAKVLCKIAAPVGRIAGDDAIITAFKDIAKLKTDIERIDAVASDVIPLLFDAHFDDACEVISVLTEKTAEVVASQPWTETYKDAIAIWDDELLRFFKSAARINPKM